MPCFSWMQLTAALEQGRVMAARHESTSECSDPGLGLGERLRLSICTSRTQDGADPPKLGGLS